MGAITKELSKLKNNIQNYTVQKAQSIEQDAEKYMQKIKKAITILQMQQKRNYQNNIMKP